MPIKSRKDEAWSGSRYQAPGALPESRNMYTRAAHSTRDFQQTPDETKTYPGSNTDSTSGWKTHNRKGKVLEINGQECVWVSTTTPA